MATMLLCLVANLNDALALLTLPEDRHCDLHQIEGRAVVEAFIHELMCQVNW
jgi:hypothetical protein